MFKNEEGFSLLELSIAAAVAVALGAVALGTVGTIQTDMNTKGVEAQTKAQKSIDDSVAPIK